MMLLGIIDVETTGLDPKKDDLIEVAVARFDTYLGFVDVSSRLVTHRKEVTGAFEIHGIEHGLIERFGEIGHELPRVDCLVAHNAEFDRKWLDVNNTPWACTIDMEWPRKPPNKSLVALALSHGVGVISAHRAVQDVLTLVRIFERAKELGGDLDYIVRRALRPKSTYQALVSFDEKQLAKDAGFHWEPDTKRWLKNAFTDETFCFNVREVSA